VPTTAKDFNEQRNPVLGELMREHDGGKGDAPRPFSVDLEKFAENFDRIFGKKQPEEVKEQEKKDEHSERSE
jgi:hypothetical protein